MISPLDRVRIILVSPGSGENVGAVCRAMKTMGITDLRIVGSADFDLEKARIVAVHAEDVLDKRRHHPTLVEAVSGCALIAGTTRRWGKHRKSARYTPAELACRVVTIVEPTGLVFGCEADGLSDADLDVCHTAVTIPSSPDYRSINLSHAVQICVYEIYKRLQAATGKRFYQPIGNERLETMVGKISDNLMDIGVVTGNTAFLRDIFARAALSRSESERISGLFEKITGIIGKG